MSRHRADEYNRVFLTRWANQSATVRIVRSLIYRIGSRPPGVQVARADGPRTGSDLTPGVSNAYVKNIELVRMLAKEHGFIALFYLQPVSARD